VTDRLRQSDEAQDGQTELRGGQRRSDEARGRGASDEAWRACSGDGRSRWVWARGCDMGACWNQLSQQPPQNTHTGSPYLGMGSVSAEIFSAHDMTYEEVESVYMV
jgi:hypothetical protein